MSAERIIFVPFIGPFAGVERLVLGLSRFLHDRGIEHTVVCFRQTIDFAAYATWPLTVHQLAPRRHSTAEAWALHSQLRAAGRRGSPPPLLFELKSAFYAGLLPRASSHLHLTDPPSLLPADISKFAPSLRECYGRFTQVSTVSPVKRARGEIVHRINRRGLRNALSVVTMTNAIASELQAVYQVAATTIHPGVRPPPQGHFKHGGTSKLRLLSVSRLEPNKRLDWMLQALALCSGSGSAGDWELHVVGGGPDRQPLEELAIHLGFSKRVVFHGPVSDGHLDALFAESDLMVIPATQGYGLPALEALSRNVPVVLHRESGVSEVLTGTIWVDLVTGGVEALSEAIGAMCCRIRRGDIQRAPTPVIPTETDWACQLSTHCGWL